MPEKTKKRNHFSSLEKREALKAKKDAEAIARGEKTESEMNQPWKFKPVVTRKAFTNRGLTNTEQFLKDAAKELTDLKLRRFKEKEGEKLIIQNGEMIKASEKITDAEKIALWKEKQELVKEKDKALSLGFIRRKDEDFNG